MFYSDVRDLIQTVVLPDTTTQTQNVGDGRFYGAEFGVDAPMSPAADGWRQLHRAQPDDPRRAAAESAADRRADAQGLSLCGVAADEPLTITPSLDVAGDRWSEVNPAPAFPYVRTGSYTLLDLSAQYAITERFDVVFGLKNLTDETYSWPGASRSLAGRFT